ncbi:hypothetical protein EJA71_01460 [Pseudomonas sp. PB106]|nr:hypothetical protein EJA71_01460 [Pseudomonas sp. PB106]
MKTDRRPFVGSPTNNRNPCGSWLASDSSGSATIFIGCADAIAGKPAPTGFVCSHLAMGLECRQDQPRLHETAHDFRF